MHASGQGTKSGAHKGSRVLVALQLVGALVLVIVSADAFTNAVEWIDARTSLTRGAAGAVVAAIGSSLPETIIALIALVVLHDARSEDIGIGTVIGAPFMLATVVFSLIGVTALMRRDRPPVLAIPAGSTVYGSVLFFCTFAVALAASFGGSLWVRVAATIAVLCAYGLHVHYHLREGDEIGEQIPPALRIAPRAQTPSWRQILLQLALSLVVTTVASRWFVGSLRQASIVFGIAPLVIALFLSPIATELPEVSSVILWMRRREDQLAMNNVLGAMMFQTSIACSIAMLASPWRLPLPAQLAGVLALVAVTLVALTTVLRRCVEPVALATCGALYLGYVVFNLVR